MRKLFGIVAATAFLLVLVSYFSLASVAKYYLEGELGKRSFSDVVKEADAGNRRALGQIKSAEILVDIPAESITAALGDELQKAANLAELGSGWTAEFLSRPVISFHPSAIRANTLLKLSSDDVGAATIDIQLDIIPSIQKNELIAVPYVTALSLSKVDISGIRLPGWVADKLSDVIDKALEALNTRVPKQRIAIQLPEKLLQSAQAKPAILVVNDAVAALLGEGTEATREIDGAYSDEFIKLAKTVLPSYLPGEGVIAVRPSGSPLIDVTESMRDEAAAANLAALESILGIQQSTKPEELTFPANPVVMVTAEARYFSRRLKDIAVKAISEIEVDEVVIDVKPENVSVVLKEGVVEASASGTAALVNGKLSIDFSLTAWGVLRPGPDGLVASYAPREIRVSSVRVAWADRGTTLSVPYNTALGDVVARFIENLPDSPLDVPGIPLNIASEDKGDFKLHTQSPSLLLSLSGRAVAITSDRVSVFALATFEGKTGGPPQRDPSPDQLQRLTALSVSLHHALVGKDNLDSLLLAIPKAGFAALLETAWVKLNPTVSLTHQSMDTFDAGEINIIPGDASCGNPCKGVNECGKITDCTRHICTTVVVDGACHTFCPGGRWNPICREVCDRVSREVCHDESDNGCISRIQGCSEEVAKCTTTWGSGLQASCEIALKSIKMTDKTGIAKLKGGVAVDASATTVAGSRLVVAPDLTEISLAIDAGGVAGIDTWLDITWTDWGNLFLCPSGRLSLHLDVAARLATSPLTSELRWEPVGSVLKGTFFLGNVSVIAQSSEGPLGELIKSNPGLLTCSLGQTIVGLTAIALPRFTQELLADSIRAAANGNEEAEIAAAIIDGRYQYEGEIPSAFFKVPPMDVMLLEETVRINPDLSESAIILGTGDLQ